MAKRSSSRRRVVPLPARPCLFKAPLLGEGVTATYVLAISWEPAFCEDHEGKSECQRETEQTFDATHFSLHGLWPQPKGNFYCHGATAPAKRQTDAIIGLSYPSRTSTPLLATVSPP